jgi:hypothetical protein
MTTDADTPFKCQQKAMMWATNMEYCCDGVGFSRQAFGALTQLDILQAPKSSKVPWSYTGMWANLPRTYSPPLPRHQARPVGGARLVSSLQVAARVELTPPECSETPCATCVQTCRRL